MTISEVFSIGTPADGRRVLDALARSFPSEEHVARTSERVFLDTFDWRVRRAGHALSLAETGGVRWLLLESLDRSRSLRQRFETPPAFAADLPEDPLRSWLEPVTGVRRLLPRVAMRAERRVLDLLDDGRRTVSRAVLEGGTAWCAASPGPEGSAAKPLPLRLVLEELCGHAEQGSRASRVCAQTLGLASATDRDLDLALATLGLGPPEDPSRPRIRLAPEGTAEACARAVLHGYLDVVEANEDGARAELDTEFLHDFRVAVRRTRSILSVMGDVFPPAAVERFGAELGWLGRLTGTARDLDVYLLELAGHGKRAELIAFLRRRRVEEQRAIVVALDGERRRALFSGWRAFLSEGSPETPEIGLRPVREVVSERLRRLHADLLRRGRAISGRTRAQKIHRIRIRAKRLRYTLDAFRSLYDDQGVALVIDRLKGLQNVLGRFNDLGVQQALLRRLAAEAEARGAGSARLFWTLGRELERKRALKKRVRRSVRPRFERFDGPETSRRFHRLLDGGA